MIYLELKEKKQKLEAKKQQLLEEIEEEIQAMPQYITCTKTGMDLEKITDQGKYVLMHSYGLCRECRWPYSVEELSTHDGMAEMSWPVKYVGLYCKECVSNL